MPVAPMSFGPRSSATSSTSPAATKLAATRGPPSTISRVMPSVASVFNTWSRSSLPFCSSTRNTRQPFCVRMSSATGEALVEQNTQVGRSRTVETTDSDNGTLSRASSTTRTGERSYRPGRRQVSCGLSDSTVPSPVRMASLCDRIWCTRARAASPVICAALRPASAALPSADTASLSSTCGRPCVILAIWPAWARRASSANRPVSTVTPLVRSLAWPCPATSGLGSSSADTTRLTPALTMASAQGGVLPSCEHGSSVTYSVAPCAARLARRSASVSACGRPPSCVQPRPTMTPSLTMTAPTAGLGAVLPSPRRPSDKASRMKRSSALLKSFRGAPSGASPESITPVLKIWLLWLWIPGSLAIARRRRA